MAGRYPGTPVSKEALLARVEEVRNAAARAGKIVSENETEDQENPEVKWDHPVLPKDFTPPTRRKDIDD